MEATIKAATIGQIANSGGKYCVTLISGKYAGQVHRQHGGQVARYKGTITDPADDKTYAGSAKVSGAGHGA